MTKIVNSPDKYLSLGIDAVRTGRRLEARRYFDFALKQSPNHIPTLLWLAFVAPTVQQSQAILEQVLVLDPDNERAKAGLAWAEQQLSDRTPPEPQTTIPASLSTTHQKGAVQKTAGNFQVSYSTAGRGRVKAHHQDDTLIVTDNIRPGTVKGGRMQRARGRGLNPLLAVSIILGAAAMIAGGIWLWAFVPPETLAAWLPATTKIETSLQSGVSSAPVQTDSDSQAVTVKAQAEDRVVPPQGDTTVQSLVAQKTDVVPAEQEPADEFNPDPQTANDVASVAAQGVSEPDPGSSVGTAFPELFIEPVNDVAAAPLELIGPVGEAVNGYKLNEPVDEGELAHIPAHPGEKWIEVDVTRQTVTAWEGNVPVLSFLVSTGLPNTPTVFGNFNIYWKLESTLMSGPGYYLPDVPYTMYFFGGYGLHGTYWHDNFGEPMSHGCVNLRNEHAKQLFDWADPVIPPGQTQVTSSASNPGTLVVVHD
jgi:lipoprotein-anchoring transpeptidase ErfK/SrfK